MPRNPLGLFNAVTIGLGLGFFAVLLWPRLLVAYNEAPKTAEVRAGVGAAELAAKEAPAPAHEDAASARQPSPEEATPIQTQQQRLVPAFKAAFPKPFLDEEMTAALSPLLSFKLAESDVAALKLLVAAVQKNNGEASSEALKKVADPAARTFGEWKRSRRYDADFDQALAFSQAHPLFPAPVQDANSERSLFLSNATNSDVLRFFSNRSPLTSAGTASYAGALLDSAQRERGMRLVRQVWKRYPMDPAVRERFSARFGTLLEEKDRQNRLLLLAARESLKDDKGGAIKTAEREKSRERFKDDRKASAAIHPVKAAVRAKAASTSPRTYRGNIARRSKRLGRYRGQQAEVVPPTQEVPAPPAAGPRSVRGASSLMALAQLKPNSQPVAAAQPEATTKSNSAEKAEPAKKTGKQAKVAENAINLTDEVDLAPASLLSKLKLLRRHNADDDVWSLLRSVDPNKADLSDPDRWWAFRRAEVRRALDEERPRTAYGIASVHGPLDDEQLSEAEFLAGWIAMEFIHDARLAIPIFARASSRKV